MNCNQLFFCFLVTKTAIVARADTAAFRLSLLNLLYFPVSCEPSIPLDLVLVIDSSGSIRQQNDPTVLGNNDPNDNWQRMMTFLWDLTWQFDDTTLQIGIVMFSSSAQIITQFTDPQSARNQIDAMRQNYDGGLTNTAAGLRQASSVLQLTGNRPEVSDVVIVLTDGVPTINIGDVYYAALELRNGGAFIGLVGIGGNTVSSRNDYANLGITELESDVIFVPNFSDLRDKVAATASLICSHLLNQVGGCVQPNCHTVRGLFVTTLLPIVTQLPDGN